MPKEKQLQTLIAIATGLLGFYIYTSQKWLLISALVVMLIAIFSEVLTEKIARIWIKVAEILGNINGKIILSIIFFLILTPIALVYNWLKKSNMQLSKQEGSYYVTRNHLYKKEDLEKMW